MARTVESKRLHPRVAVSGICFPTLSALESIAAVADLGVTKTSMTWTKLRDSGSASVLEACGEHGVEVVTTTSLLRFDLSVAADPSEQMQLARENIDQAAAVGAKSIYTLTGPRAYADWMENVEAYASLVASTVRYAAERGMALAVEPTNWLYADLNFVHSFHDAITFASHTGMQVCLDLFHVWTEGRLREDIKNHVELISHVQLSDMQRGSRALPCRVIPGDGDVPLRSVVQWLLDAGYQGVFDLELTGPGIDELGHREAAKRSAAWLNAFLTERDA